MKIIKSLETHKKYHTKKHMDYMIRLIKQGKSLRQAHNITIKKIGK